VVLFQPGRNLYAGDSWKKIRYQGGTVDASVNRFDWNTTLATTAGEIELVFGGRTTVRIAVTDIGALSYGQRAYRRVADMAALSVVLTPVALFGLLHKSRDHLVGIEFKSPTGQPGAVLLMVHKDSYRELLMTLKGMTGKPIENWP
jgi:hypothetical protein